MMLARAFPPRRIKALPRLTSLLAALAILAFAASVRARANEEIRVDVELVLAVDISYSMDEEEQTLQRQGYIQALTSKDFLERPAHGNGLAVA